jgi:hypothetical protein
MDGEQRGETRKQTAIGKKCGKRVSAMAQPCCAPTREDVRAGALKEECEEAGLPSKLRVNRSPPIQR